MTSRQTPVDVPGGAGLRRLSREVPNTIPVLILRRPRQPGDVRPAACDASAAEARPMIVKIFTNDKSTLPGYLADAEVHFTDGPLDGLKLMGFTVWERKSGSGRNVTFPARQYTMNGERRSFSLLRPTSDTTASNRLRDVILAAYDDYAATLAATG
jgi:hypothetical protein